MRWLAPFLVLALCGFTLFAEEGARAEPTVEEQIQELEKKRARLVEERDAARMRANVYVLPQDKLEAQAKQEEIDEVDRQLRALREGGAEEGASKKEADGPL